MEKIGGWYVMSSAKKREKENEISDTEVPSWKEILESQQTHHDVYSQYARLPRTTVLPSLKTRRNHELEVCSNSHLIPYLESSTFASYLLYSILSFVNILGVVPMIIICKPFHTS